MKWNKSQNLAITLALSIAMIAFNILASRHSFRLDFTQNKIYTLAASTKELLNGLDDVVTLRLYFTEEMPAALLSLKRNVEDIISEFKKASNNKIQIEYLDPSASPMEEQKAMMLGIPPVQLNVIEKDKRELAKIYLGIALMYGHKQEIIPVVQRIDNLEYDLVQGIMKISSKEQPKIAWVGPKDDYSIIKESTSKRFELNEISKDNVSDLDTSKYSALILVGTKDVDESILKGMDSFLISGGNVFVMAGRWKIENDMRKSRIESPIFKQLESYGAMINEDMVLDRSNAMASFSGGMITYHIPYPFWPQVQSEGFSKDNSAVSQLQSLVLPWTSSVSSVAVEGMAVSALASTTEYGVAKTGDQINIDPQSAAEDLKGKVGSVITLAKELKGKFTSSFTGERSEADGNLIVIGNSIFISDIFVQQFPENGIFFQNLLDSSAYGNKLVGIRSRAEVSRPLAVLPDGMNSVIRWINMLFVPVLLAIFSLFVYLGRKRKNRQLHMEYNRT